MSPINKVKESTSMVKLQVASESGWRILVQLSPMSSFLWVCLYMIDYLLIASWKKLFRFQSSRLIRFGFDDDVVVAVITIQISLISSRGGVVLLDLHMDRGCNLG